MDRDVVMRFWRAHERRIEPAVAQRSQQVPGHERPDFDAHVWVLLSEPVNHPRDGAEFHEWLPANRQVPPLVPCDLSGRLDTCVEARDDRTGALGVFAALTAGAAATALTP